MRILFATMHAHLPQAYGGSQSSTDELCHAARSQGHEVAVLAGLRGGDAVWLQSRLRARLAGQPAFGIDRLPGYPVYRSWAPDEAVAEACRHFRPDIALVQAGQPLQMAAPLLAAGVRTVIYLRDVAWQNLGGDPRALSGLGYIANSAFTAARLLADFGIVAPVIPPLIVAERYRVAQRGSAIVQINPDPSKGGTITLALAEQLPDIPFRLIESWPSNRQLHDLKAWAARLPNVSWHRPSSDMREVYRHARLVLVPSQLPEAWGRIVSEAQVSGIPAVVSDIGGLPEALGPGGLRVAPQAPLADWLDAINRIVRNPAQEAALSAAAHQHAARPEAQAGALFAQLLKTLSPQT